MSEPDTVIAAIIEDIRCRKGIGDEWENIDVDVRGEIVRKWRTFFRAPAPSSAGEWIPVWERLPEESAGKSYVLLAWTTGGLEEYNMSTRENDVELIDMANTLFVHANARKGWFTHWMPLPAAPSLPADE